MAKANKSPAQVERNEAGVSAPWETNVPLPKGKSLTQPPFIKIADMPVGAVLTLKVLSLVPSNNKKIDNPSVIGELKDGSKVSLPVVAALSSAILNKKIEKADLKDVTDADTDLIGKTIAIKKTGVKASKEYFLDDKKQQPRMYPIFEVVVL